MKIISRMVINYDVDRETEIGEYVIYKDIILRCEGRNVSDCSGCYFYIEEHDTCNIVFPEADFNCFDCLYRNKGVLKFKRFVCKNENKKT